MKRSIAIRVEFDITAREHVGVAYSIEKRTKRFLHGHVLPLML
jgi:hypothetical protein